MEAIHQTLSTINNGLKYLQENALVIFTCVAVLWVIRGRFLQWFDPSKQGVTLSSSSSLGKNQGERLNDMMRVRQKQQEEAERQSKLAAQERKVKEVEEKKRRNELNLKKKKSETKGNTLGGSGGGYNPLQPWSSGSGGGYKAQRRTVNRG